MKGRWLGVVMSRGQDASTVGARFADHGGWADPGALRLPGLQERSWLIRPCRARSALVARVRPKAAPGFDDAVASATRVRFAYPGYKCFAWRKSVTRDA